jgi:hypothetical protein
VLDVNKAELCVNKVELYVNKVVLYVNKVELYVNKAELSWNVSTTLVKQLPVQPVHNTLCSSERCPTNAQGRCKQFFIVLNKLP